MFLVISCPCALVISIPLGYFGGIGLSSKNGILVKGGNYLEALTKASTIVFDKTGTLTKGAFYVSDINPVGMSKASLVEIVAHLESYSLHPIAKSIVDHYDDEINKDLVKEVTEMPGKGIKGMYDGKLLIVGKDNLMDEYKIEYQKVNSSGTVVYAALDNIYLGNIVIKDEIRDESKKLIHNLHKKGIKTVMLTGDNDFISKEVSKELGIDEYYASLLPQDKLEHLTRIINNKKIARLSYFSLIT
jgi:Cd2+/Zn2+-exporting ATPase